MINARPGTNQVLNDNLEVKRGGYVLVFYRLVVMPEDLRQLNESEFDEYRQTTDLDQMQSDVSSEADGTIQTVITSIDFQVPVYRVIIAAGSRLHDRIRLGKTSLTRFTTYPQLILYRNGKPFRYLNGDLTDTDQVKRFISEVIMYQYYE